MDRSTKFLIPIIIVAIALGLFLIWFGFSPKDVVTPEPSLVPQVVLQSAAPGATISPVGEPAKPAALGVESNTILITKVVDGDTVELATGEKVRLLGIDTPETVDPKRPVGCFGKEASNKVKELLTGKKVILEKDVSETDKYKRLLRYIYLPLDSGQSLFINDYLVREGYAKVLTYPPDVKYSERLLEAQREARVNNRGLWGSCQM